jgi:hypothetical protein
MWDALLNLMSEPLIAQSLAYARSNLWGFVAGASLAVAVLNYLPQRRNRKIEEFRNRPKFRILVDRGVWHRGWRHSVVDIQNPSDIEVEVSGISIRPRRLTFAPQLPTNPSPDLEKASGMISLKAKRTIPAKGVWSDDVYWLSPGPDDSCTELRATAVVQQISYPKKKWRIKANVAVPLAEYQR